MATKMTEGLPLNPKLTASPKQAAEAIFNAYKSKKNVAYVLPLWWIIMLIIKNIPEDSTPVFVGLNAPFDWSFINYYFLKYLNRNPFGITAIDIKALFMGATKCCWYDTKSSSIDRYVQPSLKGDHDALHDAQYQAELFRLVYSIKLDS